jgi:hypothetical protein
LTSAAAVVIIGLPTLMARTRSHATGGRVVPSSWRATVKALTADLNDWIARWNDDPKPFVWHKTADEILDNLKTYMSSTSDAGH